MENTHTKVEYMVISILIVEYVLIILVIDTIIRESYINILVLSSSTKRFFTPNICLFYFLRGPLFRGGGITGVWISGMPTGPFMYATDLIEVLKKKHASETYKSLVSC